MKAITLYQPWASACVCGLKPYETRSWATKHRGPIAIHAAKSVPRKLIRAMGPQYAVLVEFVRGLVDPHSFDELPFGAVVGACGLIDCMPTLLLKPRLSALDLQWGDFSPGRFAWKLIHPVQMVPVVCRGAQGLWDLPKEVERVVSQQLAALVYRRGVKADA